MAEPDTPPAVCPTGRGAVGCGGSAGGGRALDATRASARLAAATLALGLAVGAEARALPGEAAAPLGAACGEAEAEADGVVAGLAVALAQGTGRGAPAAALPELERRLEAGLAKREAFCRRVLDLSPPVPPGQRGLLGDLVGGVAKPLVEAAVAIWQRAADEDRLRRDTIRAQLEATRWPAYADVPPSR